jgi:hypothetical protein
MKYYDIDPTVDLKSEGKKVAAIARATGALPAHDLLHDWWLDEGKDRSRMANPVYPLSGTDLAVIGVMPPLERSFADAQK